MAIQLAVFDMAGTTVVDNNNVATAFQKAFSLNSLKIEREMAVPLMGYYKPLAIRMLLEKTGHSFEEELVEKIHSDFEYEMIKFYENDKSVEPMPGAEDIFTWLKGKNILVALNTGFSAVIADTIISRFQWEEKGLIDEFIGSDEVENGRPSPFMIQELMKRCKVTDSSRVVKIGDTEVDVEEGNNAGCCYVVAITTGACPEANLIKMNPTHIIHHLSQLRGIFQ